MPDRIASPPEQPPSPRHEAAAPRARAAPGEGGQAAGEHGLPGAGAFDASTVVLPPAGCHETACEEPESCAYVVHNGRVSLEADTDWRLVREGDVARVTARRHRLLNVGDHHAVVLVLRSRHPEGGRERR